MKGSLRTFALLPALVLLAWAGYRAVDHDRRAAQTMQPGAVDIGFAQSMIRHHQQAIVMAQLLLDDPDTKLAGLARAIGSAQLLEVGQMKGWLQLWDQPVLPPRGGMDWMLLGSRAPEPYVAQYLLDCRASEAGMAGLATAAELNELRLRKGSERDRLFLELMLRHHQGAITMARFAAANAALEPVKSQAAAIVVEQTEEIAAMVPRLRAISQPARSR